MKNGRQCTAQAKQTGRRCRRAAVRGASVCYYHGGAAAKVKAKAAVREAHEQAQVLANRLGVSIETTPEQAVLDLICEAAGNVSLLRRLVAEVDLASEDATASTRHPIVVAYHEERDRLFGYAAAASKIGVSERLVKIAERQGEQLAAVLEATLTDPSLRLSSEDRDRMRGILAHHLRLVATD